MADWNLPLDQLLDGLTQPQLRLLSDMRARRKAEERYWQFFAASITAQSEAQVEAAQEIMDYQSMVMDGEQELDADMGGDAFHVSRRYPLLHELTPTTARMMGLDKLVKFHTVVEEAGQ